MLNTFFNAALQLGLPVAVITWLLLTPLFRQGLLDRSGDESVLDAELDSLRKDGTRRAYDPGSMRGRVGWLAEKKWFEFGGGFYGCAALWTFVVVELKDLFGLLGDWNLSEILAQGIFGAALALLLNQIENLITAVTWFLYWGHGATIPIWIAAAYLGFRLGSLISRQLR